jgi:hypothetical protein
MHQRCHRQKATEKWIIPSRTGIEFVDTSTGNWITNHWTRAGCVFGLVPSNGFVNITPHNCACYFQSKTFGFSAMAPAHLDANYPQPPAPANRIIPGPAYSEPLGSDSGEEDWPTYRGDSIRTGYKKTIVPADLIDNWEVAIGGKLTTMTVANGNIYVASIEDHTLYALDEANGQTEWTYMAGGRVDSPPSIYKGRVIFGCADGYVYCLRETDGTLIWKFQAAPENLRMTSFEQVESVWPLHGSTLLINDEVYCIAGRNMFLDGGLRFLRIDPNTGALIDEVVLDELDPETGENLQVHVKNKTMPVALPDVLSSDGRWVFMRKQRFDLAGNRYEIPPLSSVENEVASDQYGVGVHLFGNAGFLDGYYMHRTYWIWGRSWSSGAGGYSKNGKYAPAGRIMAIGPDRVYGYGRNEEFYKWSVPLEYELFSAVKYPASQTIEYQWTNTDVNLMANAIVLADKILFVAGPPDVVDEVDAYDWWSMEANDPNYNPNIPTQLFEQDAAWNDQRGALLRAVDIADGQTMAQYDLESVPVWDGLIAANGRLLVAMQNGKVKSFVGTNYPPRIDPGQDRNIYPMSTAVLDANVIDDGIPTTDPNDSNTPPVGVTCSWSQLSGPGTVTFDDPCQVDTTADFSTWGKYTLRLSATDSVYPNYEDLKITVSRPGDLDDDNDVDIDDLDNWVNKWLSAGCDNLNEWCLGADQASSGSVDLTSYDVIALNWLLGVEPDTPKWLTSDSNEARISLDWDDNEESDLAGYNVYRSLMPGTDYTKINSSLLADSDYVDTNATDLLTYFYAVTAIDDGGFESLKSEEVSGAKGTQPGVKLIAGIGVTTDVNNNVTLWLDQANVNHASPADANMPAYIASAINGQPAIEFYGGGEHLNVADSDQINKKGPFDAKTLVIVFKTSSDITSKQNIWEQGGGTRGGLNFYIQDSNLYINGWTIKADDGYADWGLTASITAVDVNVDTAYVATMVMDSNSGNFEGFVNGSRIGVYSGIDLLPTHGNDCAFGHTNGNSRFLSGGHSNAANFAGQIAEFYEFNAILSTSEREGLENFLIGKYGL